MGTLRFITATALFDGHDASINIIRRILQDQGVEVVHLGHNRSAREIVVAALQEDVQAIALSSYQGGHVEYFTYVRRLLLERGGESIKIFGGGGGVITPVDTATLHERGITRIYSPEDGLNMGLVGIVKDMVKRAQNENNKRTLKPGDGDDYALARAITSIENRGELPFSIKEKSTPVLGVTGTGGAGKSSLIDEIILRFCRYYPEKRMALLSVDPTRKKTQGALLGDRIRLGSTSEGEVFVRSLATRHSGTELSPHMAKVLRYLRAKDFDLILVETSGIGQASDAVVALADRCLFVMTPEYGAATQLEKIEMLDKADFIALNKFEKPRSEDALRDIRKQFARNKSLFGPKASDNSNLPLFGTVASRFNDPGTNDLFCEMMEALGFTTKHIDLPRQRALKPKGSIIPPDRSLYLREIAQCVGEYNKETEKVCGYLEDYDALERALSLLPGNRPLEEAHREKEKTVPEEAFTLIATLEDHAKKIKERTYTYRVREREISLQTNFTTLAGNDIPLVATPGFSSRATTYRFAREENLPGFFPFAQGIFPFKRKDEAPRRMFAGVGGPARTNERFHYLSKNDSAKRLSTAFDSITLYGENPHERPDIFGKIGEAGVSVATLDDMETLYRGFDLTNPSTSVSMTINGPAPIMLAMFFSVGLKQKLAGKDYMDESKRIPLLRQLRGTVQADILKEDQAQNTCIFSLEFALKMMGDMQAYLSEKKIKNYYSVSISGYHIAEAGANPITQAALTLSNGFTYIEYYLGRGMGINDFAENLSFFFSNGLDPEYAVIGRVARKIWAVTLRDKYKASPKTQKFKYHIQTSGRSLHAQEIDFNDIRTTLQAFLALCDNCNSLHTNAYDEAITTPTEESVRRAMAIQMIINREFGLGKTVNPLQGSFLLRELTEIVEEAILREFERISDKGGVLGAMESMYQRGKIQDESLYYETLKDSGELEIIGVNTYLDGKGKKKQEVPLSRCSRREKEEQIERLRAFQERNKKNSPMALERLRARALSGGNIFEELLSCVNVCSLGEMTHALYSVGGKYRRNN